MLLARACITSLGLYGTLTGAHEGAAKTKPGQLDYEDGVLSTHPSVLGFVLGMAILLL